LRMSRVFATGLGDQNMVIEDVTIETETSREKQPKATEVLVLSVRPKASQEVEEGQLPPQPVGIPRLQTRASAGDLESRPEADGGSQRNA